MSASSYGIIVEGVYDSAVYEVIIKKISPGAPIKPLECRGRANLMKTFPGLLKAFEHELAGNPVDMALVIRDGDGKPPDRIEGQMRGKIANWKYPFRLGVKFFAVPQAMESWLLADVNALNTVSQRRGKKQVTKSLDSPETLPHPKESLRQLLSEHNLTYAPELAREIAQEINLDTLSRVCPRFRVFSERVDC